LPRLFKSFGLHRRLILIVLLVAGVSLASFYGYSYFTAGLSPDKLERVQADDTSFLAPTQWNKINDATYGTGDSADASDSLVSVRKASYATAAYTSQPASVITTYRSALLANTTALNIEETFAEFLPCDSLSDTQKDLYREENQLAIGLMQLSATCKRQDRQTAIEARMYLGNDGYLRYIYVAAPADSWDKNAEAYQAMLSGLDQPN
jgi:hypothetical protein